jgi:hypothetical protein
MDGVPVEFRVATIFCAITALLPIPLITSRPLQVTMASTAFSKSVLMNALRPWMDWASICIVRRAVCLMEDCIRLMFADCRRLTRPQIYSILKGIGLTQTM